ncbi:hypothetical protein P3T25_006495 [Paraburkholderia sp. GAS32]
MANSAERLDSGQALQLGTIYSFRGVQVGGGSNPLAPTKEIKALWMHVHKAFFVCAQHGRIAGSQIVGLCGASNWRYDAYCRPPVVEPSVVVLL